MLHPDTCRRLLSAPSSFDGDLQELYTSFVEPNLPDPVEVAYVHQRLVDYCSERDPIFITRMVSGQTRGQAYTTASGHRLKPSDNAPAWWMHFVAFNGVRDADLRQMPTHMFEMAKCLPQAHINNAGWHVAHILNAKDGNVNWPHWTRDELVRRFIRNVHPCNTFYVPQTNWQRYGGDPGVIGFFAARYAERYSSVWERFLALADGVQPELGVPPRYVFPLNKPAALPPQVPAGPSGHKIAASYSSSRLCFKANVVEPLEMDDTFEVITPVGTFQMTKAEFYRNFANVIQSKSYRESRIYHYPKVPQIALKFRI